MSNLGLTAEERSRVSILEANFAASTDTANSSNATADAAETRLLLGRIPDLVQKARTDLLVDPDDFAQVIAAACPMSPSVALRFSSI
eukprot:3694296-Amphidinium_carterae.1